MKNAKGGAECRYNVKIVRNYIIEDYDKNKCVGVKYRMNI